MADLQNPPVPAPETSAPPPSSSRFQPARFAANSVGIPDTSGPGPVMLQQPSRWSHDFDPGTGISRATLPAETPMFFNIPAAPTPEPGDSSQQLATTEFVHQAGAPLVAEAVLKARIGDISGFPARPGDIGELHTMQTPPPGMELTSNQITNIANIELPAGDWDLAGNICFQWSGVPPSPNLYLVAALSPTPNFPGFPNQGGVTSLNQVSNASDMALPVATRQLAAGALTVFIQAYAQFTSGRMYAYCYITARRAR